MLLLASDADVNGEIIRGLRRRVPEIDLVRVQDALPEGTPDPEVLAWAASENRVLLTNDRKTMVQGLLRKAPTMRARKFRPKAQVQNSTMTVCNP